ncbi:hypothetical protein ABW21_db0201226 [Orbilia brochopaga]|nr:hypothetical protein ABW21_db0201226 [Drechslerella brochopaga]
MTWMPFGCVSCCAWIGTATAARTMIEMMVNAVASRLIGAFGFSRFKALTKKTSSELTSEFSFLLRSASSRQFQIRSKSSLPRLISRNPEKAIYIAISIATMPRATSEGAVIV